MKTMKLMMFALLVVLASCTSKEDSLALLKGKEWSMKSMTENSTIVTNPKELPSLVLSDSTANLYGSAGCNRLMGKYTADTEGNLSIELGGSTMMFCPDMTFEDQYKKALPLVKTFTIANNELTLKDADNKLEIVYTLVEKKK